MTHTTHVTIVDSQTNIIQLPCNFYQLCAYVAICATLINHTSINTDLMRKSPSKYPLFYTRLTKYFEQLYE